MEQKLALLLEAGADINAKDIWGATPLLTALYDVRPDIAELLIAAGADLGDGAALLGADSGEPRIFSLLLARGVADRLGAVAGQELCAAFDKNMLEREQSRSARMRQSVGVLGETLAMIKAQSGSG